MKKLLLSLIAIVGFITLNAQTNNMDIERLNVRIAFGPPIQDTIAAPYKVGELRTRPQDNLWYRYNGKVIGNQRWDYVYFGPSPLITPTLDQVLNRGNVSSLPLTAGVGTFSGLKVPSLGVVGQILMATVLPDGTISAQTIPGGGTLINSINGLTASAQFLTVSFNAATSPKFNSSTATHTLNLPILSALDTGIVTPAMKTFWDAKATYPAGGTSAKYLAGDTTWHVFPTIPAQLNPTAAGGGIAITGTYPNLTFTVSNTGTLTGLTGDVTTSGSGAAVATIGTNVVSYAKMQQVAANRLLGNPTGSTANVAEIALNTGTGIGFASNQLRIDTATLIATISDVAVKLNSVDTTSMLSVYLRKMDTATLSTRINTKTGGSGTTNTLAMWTGANTLGNSAITFSSLNQNLISSLPMTFTSNFGGGSTTPIPITVNVGVNDVTGIQVLSFGNLANNYTTFRNIVQSDESVTIQISNAGTSNIVNSNAASAGIQFITQQGTADNFLSFQNHSGTAGANMVAGQTQRITGSNVFAISLGSSLSFVNSTPLFYIDAAGNVIEVSTGYTLLPKGTTAQRPASGLVSGMMRYNIDSLGYEFYNGTLWKVLGTGGSGSSAGALLITNNLSDLNNAGTARTNLGLGSLAVLNSVSNANWSGTVLSSTNGGTGVNGGAAANGRLLIGNGTGYTLANLSTSNPALVITNGAGSINLTVDTTSIVATKAWILNNPSIISIVQAGTGFNTIYAGSGGTQIKNRGFNSSVTIGLAKNNDSSLTINSLLNFQYSIQQTGANVALFNDLANPGNFFYYGTDGAGLKSWRDFTQGPITTNTNNGLFSSAYKKRLDTTLVMMNGPLSLRTLLRDSSILASLSLDTLYHKLWIFNGTSNRITIDTSGRDLYTNKYTFDIAATYAGQASIVTLGTIATGIWHGTPIQTTYGGVPAGGTSGYVLSKNSGADYDLAWIPAPAGGGGGTGTVGNVGSGYRLVQNGVSNSIKTLAAGSGVLTIDSTTNANALTINIPSIVLSLAGTANQITASTSTGNVTLSIPSLFSITNFKNSGTVELDGIVYQGNNGKMDVLVQDTTTGLLYRQPYFFIDTAGYSNGSTYVTYNGTKFIMSSITTTAQAAYTINGNNTGSSAAPTYFSPVLASALFRNQGTNITVLHGTASGNPFWGAIVLSTDVSGTLAATNGGTAQSTWTLGDMLYASAANTLSKLAGNTAATLKLLAQTGTGTVSAAPVWYTPTWTDLGTWAGRAIEDATNNKSTATGLGTSNTLYPSQNAVKVYVDNSVNALSTVYFPLAGGSLTGTGGAGFIGLITQSSAPSSPASGIRLYSGANNTLSFKGVDGNVITIAEAGAGTFTLPNLSGGSDNLVTLAAVQTLTNKTLTSPQLNFTSDAIGDVYYRNSSGVTTRLGIGTTGQVLTVAAGLPVWQDPPTTNGGVYFPGFSNTSNFSNGSVQQATWLRSGNVVHVSGVFSAVPVTGSGTMLIELSLPVASNMTQAYDLSGLSHNQQTPSSNGYDAGVIFGNSSTDHAMVLMNVGSSSSCDHYFEFQYVVK